MTISDEMAHKGSPGQTYLNFNWDSSERWRPDDLQREVCGTLLDCGLHSSKSEPRRLARYQSMLEELFDEYERWYQMASSAQYWDFDLPHPFHGHRELTDGRFSSFEQAFTQMGMTIVM